MRVLEQSHEMMTTKEYIRAEIEHIERCGRVAYKSEDKITPDSAPKFVEMIRAQDGGRGHGAVLEHSTLTVKFTTDRGVSHELVRHRLAAFTQESTRYCNYGGAKFGREITVIRPVCISQAELAECGLTDWNYAWKGMKPHHIWYQSCFLAEKAYMAALDAGWTAQQARAVLPNSLKTEIVVTANFREWMHIFELRAISPKAHPQMRALMIPLYQEMREIAPEVFSLGEPEGI